MKTHTITFPNKVGHVDEVAKRLAKSIANQGVRLKVDQLGLLWELLQACGANESDFRADKDYDISSNKDDKKKNICLCGSEMEPTCFDGSMYCHTCGRHKQLSQIKNPYCPVCDNPATGISGPPKMVYCQNCDKYFS